MLELLFMIWTIKSFGEKIRAVVFRCAVLEDDFLRVDLFADEMMANVDMFRASMKLGVVGESDGGLIVGKEFRRSGGRESQLEKEGAQPNVFTRSVENCNVFSFHGRECDRRLLL